MKKEVDARLEISPEDVALARGAREGMLAVLRVAYENGEGQIQRNRIGIGIRALLDGSFPVLLKVTHQAQLDGQNFAVSLSPKPLLPAKRAEAMNRLYNVDLPVVAEATGRDGRMWRIDNILGSGKTGNCFAYSVDSDGRVLQSVPGYTGIDRVLQMAELPVRKIFSYFKDFGEQQSDDEVRRALSQLQ
ncbi:MAG: hypothetical protein WCL07_03690 [bacterium]